MDELLKTFMTQLLQAGCSPEFVLEQGFAYAIQLQKEDVLFHTSMTGLHDGLGTDIRASWMEQAAMLLGKIARELDLTLEARTRSGGTWMNA